MLAYWSKVYMYMCMCTLKVQPVCNHPLDLPRHAQHMLPSSLPPHTCIHAHIRVHVFTFMDRQQSGCLWALHTHRTLLNLNKIPFETAGQVSKTNTGTYNYTSILVFRHCMLPSKLLPPSHPPYLPSVSLPLSLPHRSLPFLSPCLCTKCLPSGVE